MNRKEREREKSVYHGKRYGKRRQTKKSNENKKYISKIATLKQQHPHFSFKPMTRTHIISQRVMCDEGERRHRRARGNRTCEGKTPATSAQTHIFVVNDCCPKVNVSENENARTCRVGSPTFECCTKQPFSGTIRQFI